MMYVSLSSQRSLNGLFLFQKKKELVVLYPMDPEMKKELEDVYVLAKNTLKNIEIKLEEEDAKRKLYTNSQSKSKDSVPYPQFRAKDHEDVHKFIKETKKNFVRNKIPLKDQVKILRTNLRGFALEIVQKDIESTFTAKLID